MIRSVIVILVLLLYFIVTLPLYLFLLLLGKWKPKLSSRIGQTFVRWGFRFVLASSGVKLRIQGRERIPDVPVLYAANHRSLFDIPAFYVSVPQQMAFVAKKETKKLPFLSWWMKLLHCLFLDRENVRQAMTVMLQGIELVKQGTSVCIMPEGTRNHNLELLEFKEGSFKIAEKAGCPIVPVALWKTDEIFELHAPKIKKGTITICYGEPIYIDRIPKEERKQVGKLVRSRIAEMLQEIS